MLVFMHVYGHVLCERKKTECDDCDRFQINGSDTWTLNKEHANLFVQMITEACIWELGRPTTLNK